MTSRTMTHPPALAAPSKTPSLPNLPSGFKPTGIIILPPSYRRPTAPVNDDDTPNDSPTDSPPSSASASASASASDALTASLPAHTLNRRSSASASSLSVSFAPLPQLAPRRRRSAAPLGIASRAQMMRRRRAGTPGYDQYGDPLPPPPPPPVWTPEEMARHAQRVAAERARAEADDPFVSLGRMVKGVWRRVNHGKDAREKDKDKGPGPEREPPGALVVGAVVVAAPGGDGYGDGAPSSGEGGVWEEEVGSGFPLNVSQTATIVEGRFPWVALDDKRASLARDDPDADADSDEDEGSTQRNLAWAEGTEEGSERTATDSSRTTMELSRTPSPLVP
ncbi:hypothetical protein B0H15DRAFT_486103 [Mycena belliarum]|uniref:Uncharacterized protein n=1 Tax=Mycena belliarum TaxID=1033014 RepID=A0AAD6TW53_9AGAR|nr:hypothetical protein B0H15DRAFT_486103 [Mycena belliae]